MNDKFYKVDLHVHTPASKCYVGDKTDEGYWEILRSAVRNGVRLIAITDHNTIAGYEKLAELRDKTLQEYRIIQKYDIPDEQKQEILDKVNLFAKISLVMGVEITLNPGVHIIVLCDEEARQDIDSLLSDIGYSSNHRGCDRDYLPDIDIKEFLNDERLSDKIVIAPHVDSDNGIWNDLDGTYRAAIFKSSTITAITCNSASQLNKIKTLTINEPSYKRTRPFVCINASDAHEQSKIGEKHSFFKLKDISYQGLKEAFDNPEECISDTETQDFLEYIRKSTECKPTIYLDNIDSLEKAFYAILNQGYGCVLLGINSNFHQNGIPKTYEYVEKTIESVFENIQDKNDSRYLSFRYKVEQLGNGRSAGIIIVNSEIDRLWVDESDKIYIYNEAQGFIMAGTREIESITRERILAELQDFEKGNNDNISYAIATMKHALYPISKYVLYDKFKNNSVPITYYFDIKHIKKSQISCSSPDIENGMDHGNVFYTVAFPPRLEEAVLRYSCPVYQNDEQELLASFYELKSPAIVIEPKGGCHIIEAFEKCYFESNTSAVLLIPNKRFLQSSISLYHIIAWLKTDCFLWTCFQKFNSLDLYYPQILLKSFIPFNKGFYDDARIEEKVREILHLEQLYLKDLPSPNPNEALPQHEVDLINKKCDEHNALVNRITAEIELIIKTHFAINEDENRMIKDDLYSIDVFQLDLDEQEDLEFVPEPEPVTQ